MSKILYVIPVVVLLAGCVPTDQPCMGGTEKGTVVRAESSISDCSGVRGFCAEYSYTYVNINVNGVSRTCIVNDSTAKMFVPGEVVNLQTGKRL